MLELSMTFLASCNAEDTSGEYDNSTGNGNDNEDPNCEGIVIDKDE